MYKKILSGLLALSMVVPAFADVSSAGGTGSVPVELNAAATNFSVTVPTGLPVDVAADGTITVCQENSIINNSFGPVEVKAAKIETVSGWTLKDFTSRFETLKVNAQEFGFQLNECNVNADGSVAVTNFTPINGGDSQAFTYDAKVAPQAEQLGKQQIASVVFTLGWSGSDVMHDGKPHAMGTEMSVSRLRTQAKDKTGAITFSREKHDESKHGVGVDISEAQDGTVMCVTSGENVTVYGEGGVKAPANSACLFVKQPGTGSNGWVVIPYAAKTLNLDGLDTSGVTTMQSMFQCSLATKINGLTSFDTSKVTHMGWMFDRSSATSLDLSSFDMSKVSITTEMLYRLSAKKVYCRTQGDLDKMKNSYNCAVPGSGFVLKDN